MKSKYFCILCIGAIVVWVAGCAPQATVPPSPTAEPTAKPTEIPSPFDYDSSVPFAVKINSETERDGVTVVDLSYAAHDPSFSPPTLGRTIAYLVKPQGDGPFAGAIYVHWLGTYVTSNSSRSQYLEEAVMLARDGTVCLLVQGYYPWMTLPRATEEDRTSIIQQTIELRRAIDFLLSQPGVDSKRIAFVGHDYGALYGGILSGVDRRVKAFVLVSGAPSFSNWTPFLGSLDDYQQENYLPLVEDIDPIQFVPHASPASLFFQFGRKDIRVPDAQAERLYAAASEPKKIEWYDDLPVDPHEMLGEAVRQARLTWLIDKLGLTAVP